jgi:hypothetical protein
LVGVILCAFAGGEGDDGNEVGSDSDGSDGDLAQGDLPFAGEDSWWDVHRAWAEALPEAGPAVAAVDPPLLRTVIQTVIPSLRMLLSCPWIYCTECSGWGLSADFG